jgi:Flp pilus assembly protein TadG
MQRVRHLLRERRGVATIEFALLTLFFFAVMLLALDFGAYFIQRSRIGSAVSAASLSTFSARTNVPFTNIAGYVQNAAQLPALQVSVTCNGSMSCANSSRSCACLTKTGSFVGASCGATCGTDTTASSTAGYYLRISATTPYQAMVLPKGMLNGTPITQSVTVRLE